MTRLTLGIFFLLAATVCPASPVYVVGSGNVGIYSAAALLANGERDVHIVSRRRVEPAEQIATIRDTDGQALGTVTVRFLTWQQVPPLQNGSTVLIATNSEAVPEALTEIAARTEGKQVAIIFGQNGLLWESVKSSCRSAACYRLLYNFGMTAKTTGQSIEITRIADAAYTLAYDQKPPPGFSAVESLIGKMDVIPSRGQVKLGVKENILQAEFDKILINAASNGPNTIFGFLRQRWRLRELAEDVEAIELAKGILREVINVGKAYGLTFDPAVIDQVIGRWRGESAEHTTSMAQQFRRDRTAALEIEPIYDRVAALGRSAGVNTPYLGETAAMLRHLTRKQEPDPRCVVASMSSLAKNDNCLALRASDACVR